MYISVDPKSSVPLYVQVKEQLHLAVATGALEPGDQVATVRDLAARLRVNFNTIARVYRELQTEGLFVSRQGSGTFVADSAERVGQTKGRAILQQRLAEAAALGHSLNLTAAEMRQLAQEAWTAASLAAEPRAVPGGAKDEVQPDE